MEKSDKKNLYKAVDLANESCIVISDKCFAIVGTNGEALTLLSLFIEQLKNMGLPEELIMDAVELGFKDDEEKAKMIIDIFKKSFGGK